jgi:hypothetical protein
VTLSPGLAVAESGQILVDDAIQALFVNAQERELRGLLLKGERAGQGDADLGVVTVGGGFRVLSAEGVDVRFDGAEMVKPPCVPGDAVGQLELHDGFGGEIGDELGLEGFEDGPVFIGKGDDLAGYAVAFGV